MESSSSLPGRSSDTETMQNYLRRSGEEQETVRITKKTNSGDTRSGGVSAEAKRNNTANKVMIVVGVLFLGGGALAVVVGGVTLGGLAPGAPAFLADTLLANITTGGAATMVAVGSISTIVGIYFIVDGALSHKTTKSAITASNTGNERAQLNRSDARSTLNISDNEESEDEEEEGVLSYREEVMFTRSDGSQLTVNITKEIAVKGPENRSTLIATLREKYCERETYKREYAIVPYKEGDNQYWVGIYIKSQCLRSQGRMYLRACESREEAFKWLNNNPSLIEAINLEDGPEYTYSIEKQLKNHPTRYNFPEND